MTRRRWATQNECFAADISHHADRRAFVSGAIAAFLAQTVTDAVLLILDDGADPVADLVPADPRIRYVREAVRRPVEAIATDCARWRGCR